MHTESRPASTTMAVAAIVIALAIIWLAFNVFDVTALNLAYSLLFAAFLYAIQTFLLSRGVIKVPSGRKESRNQLLKSDIITVAFVVAFFAIGTIYPAASQTLIELVWPLLEPLIFLFFIIAIEAYRRRTRPADPP